VGWYIWSAEKAKVKASSKRKCHFNGYLFYKTYYIPGCWTLWQCKSHTRGPITPGSSPSMLPCLASCCTGFTIRLPPPESTGFILIGSRTLARGSGMLAPLQDTEILNSYIHRWFNTKFKLNIPSSLITKQTNKILLIKEHHSMLKHIYSQDTGASDQNATATFHHIDWQVFTFTLMEKGAWIFSIKPLK